MWCMFIRCVMSVFFILVCYLRLYIYMNAWLLFLNFLGFSINNLMKTGSFPTLGSALYSVWPYMRCRLIFDASVYVKSPYIRRRFICGVVLYSTPPYMRSRLIFDAALYAVSSYIRRRRICGVALYATPLYMRNSLICDAALYSRASYLSCRIIFEYILFFPQKNILTVWYVGVKNTPHVAVSNITHSNYYT